MANPLTVRRAETYEGPHRNYNDRQGLVDEYNRELAAKGRTDIEWALDDSRNLYLRDTEAYTKRKTKWLKARAQIEHEKFVHFLNNPYRADIAA